MTIKHLRRNGWTLLGTVESEHDPWEYEIKRSPDGTIGCACMGWAFRKHCKHVDGWHGAEAQATFTHRGMATVTVPAMKPPKSRRPVVVAATEFETMTVRRAISFGGL